MITGIFANKFAVSNRITADKRNFTIPKTSLNITNDSFISFRGTTQKLPDTVSSRIDKLKSEMKKENIDALIVASTDNYLTECVEPSQSQRQYISGFNGSDGDVVIMPEKSRLIVDSRYYLQAENQVDSSLYQIEKLGLNEKGERIRESNSDRQIKILKDLVKDSPRKTFRVGYDAYKISLGEFANLKQKIKEMSLNIELVPTKRNLVDKIWKDKETLKTAPMRSVPFVLVGESSVSKISKIRKEMKEKNYTIFVATDLGDIAYLTNTRGQDIKDNAVFKSKLVLTEDRAILFCDSNKITNRVKKDLLENFEIKPEKDFLNSVKDLAVKNPQRPFISDSLISKGLYDDLKDALGLNDKIIELETSPVEKMRAIKNPVELKAYKDAIKNTDIAVTQVMQWLSDSLSKGETVTEKHLEDKMIEAHFANGANALSFPVIPASGTNSAIVHYENGNPEKIIQKNDLILLDTGAYYESGLATDLTRTWIAGGKNAEPTSKQKEVYTTVVKGALYGSFADLPPKATGYDLDAIVRTPIKAKNPDYNYVHATGHGVGVVVHEKPPYIYSSMAAKTPLVPGMVFSIEPGAYIKDWGGVRFENLVTVVPHPNPQKAKKGWHKIECLSFAPIDYNLIDRTLLKEKELKLLASFDKKSKAILHAATKIKA